MEGRKTCIPLALRPSKAWDGNFVNKMLVDIQDIRASFDGFYHMTVPYLVKKCL
jgi:hypothetical protein